MLRQLKGLFLNGNTNQTKPDRQRCAHPAELWQSRVLPINRSALVLLAEGQGGHTGIITTPVGSWKWEIPAGSRQKQMHWELAVRSRYRVQDWTGASPGQGPAWETGLGVRPGSSRLRCKKSEWCPPEA